LGIGALSTFKGGGYTYYFDDELILVSELIFASNESIQMDCALIIMGLYEVFGRIMPIS
jgi:hypothetical protein